MLDLADITLLLAVAVVALTHNIFYFRPRIRRHASEAKRYQLFAVRDDLVRLVAENKLREEDLVFQIFYKTSNFLVARPDHYITLSSFVKSLSEARAKGLDPADDPKVKALEDAVAKCDKEVANTVRRFYAAIMNILWENSLLLRIMVRCRRFFPKRSTSDDHLPPTQRQAYSFYREYSKASERVAAA